MKLQYVCLGSSIDRSLVVQCGSVAGEVINELLSWTGADISQQKCCYSTLLQTKQKCIQHKKEV